MTPIKIDDLEKELDKIFVDFTKASFETRQKALQAGAEVYVNALENASPEDSGEFKKSWEIKDKYKDRRYVGNTKTVSGGGKTNIPLSNILEYKEGGKHYGLMRRTYESVESQIFDAIKNKISNGGN